METFSALLVLCEETKASEVSNNRKACDLRLQRAHYDVSAMRSLHAVVNSLW